MKHRTSILLPISILLAFAGTGMCLCLAYPSLLTHQTADDNNNNGDIAVKSASKTTSVKAEFEEGHDIVGIDMNEIEGVILNVSVNKALDTSDTTAMTLEVNVEGSMADYIYPSFAGTKMNTTYVADYAFAFDFLEGTIEDNSTTLSIPVQFDWADNMKPTTMDSYKAFVSHISDGTSAFNFTVRCSIQLINPIKYPLA